MSRSYSQSFVPKKLFDVTIDPIFFPLQMTVTKSLKHPHHAWVAKTQPSPLVSESTQEQRAPRPQQRQAKPQHKETPSPKNETPIQRNLEGTKTIQQKKDI